MPKTFLKAEGLAYAVYRRWFNPPTSVNLQRARAGPPDW